MTMWILELYDEWYGSPVTVGVYSTMENAQAACDILLKQIEEVTLMDPTLRYDMIISPIMLNSYIDSALAWVSGG